MKASSKCSGVGFTLIELLVVIAIIAILAAILFPVFAKVREKARQTSCLSNEKQIGLAFSQYEEDYDETTPPDSWNNPNGWAGAIYSYVKSTGVFKCPDDNTQPVTVGGVTAVPVSYAMNINLNGNVNGQNGGFWAGDTLSMFNAPASTVLLSEVSGAAVVVTQVDEDTKGLSASPIAGWQSPTDDGYWCSGLWGGGCAKYATGDLGARTPATSGISNLTGVGLHTGGSNFLAADGHAKYLLPTNVSSGYTAAALGLPQQTDEHAAATDTLYIDTAKTHPAAMTFSPV